LEGNSDFVAERIESISSRLDALATALRDVDNPGSRTTLHDVLQAGKAGVSSLPGKHGSAERYATHIVVIDDRPGQLASLLTDVGELGVNLEDMSLEHSPGAPVGFVELSVAHDSADVLREGLDAKGWRISGDRG
jgi:ACT-domain-containing protein, predicted allosteric regulator of homoserine dehydrogenase